MWESEKEKYEETDREPNIELSAYCFRIEDKHTIESWLTVK